MAQHDLLPNACLPNANLTYGIDLNAAAAITSGVWAGPATTTNYGQINYGQMRRGLGTITPWAAQDFTVVAPADMIFPPLLRCITVDVCAMRGYPCGH